MCRKTIENVETVYNYKKAYIHIDSLNNMYISYLKKQHVLLYSKENTVPYKKSFAVKRRPTIC